VLNFLRVSLNTSNTFAVMFYIFRKRFKTKAGDG